MLKGSGGGPEGVQRGARSARTLAESRSRPGTNYPPRLGGLGATICTFSSLLDAHNTSVNPLKRAYD
eukprot:4364304-Pyramimonas_sp.AAC.1